MIPPELMKLYVLICPSICLTISQPNCTSLIFFVLHIARSPSMGKVRVIYLFISSVSIPTCGLWPSLACMLP